MPYLFYTVNLNYYCHFFNVVGILKRVDFETSVKICLPLVSSRSLQALS